MRGPAVLVAVALVALAFGGGVAFAGLIGGDDAKSGPITGADVKDGSLTRADLAGSLRGPAGPRGKPGIGVAGLERVSEFTDYGPGSPRRGRSVARCPSGKRVVSGGGRTEGSFGAVTDAYPKGDLSGWVVNAVRVRTAGQWRVTAIAICVAR